MVAAVRRLLAATLVAACWFVAMPSAASRAAVLVPLPGSIDATGAQDVTAALNAFLASLAPGSTVAFKKGGRYRVEGTVVLDGASGVTLEGNGATLIAHTVGTNQPANRAIARGVRRAGRRGGGAVRPTRLRTHLAIRGSANVVVRDLRIVGPNKSGRYVPALEGQAGVTISGSTNVTLDQVTTRDIYGDAVYIANHSSDITIRRCTVEHAGRQGVAVVGGQQVTIERCNFESVSRSVVDLEPNTRRGAASGVHIEHNRIGRYGNFLVAGEGVGSSVGDVWLEDNLATASRGISLYVGVPGRIRKGFHVIGNRSAHASAGYEGALMRFTHIDGVEVRDNHQPVRGHAVAVLLVGSCNATIHDNDFSGASGTQRAQGDCRTQLRRGGSASGSASRASPSRKRSTNGGETARGSGGGSDLTTVLVAGVVGVLLGAAGLYTVMRRRQRPVVSRSDSETRGG
jgi:hypothetical protein